MTDSLAEELKPNVPTMGAGSGLPPEEIDRLTDDIVAALKTVYDPEIPSDIYELGLIYRVDIADDRQVTIDMTLTAPGCPVAGEMPGWVENAVSTVPGRGCGHGQHDLRSALGPVAHVGRGEGRARYVVRMGEGLSGRFTKADLAVVRRAFAAQILAVAGVRDNRALEQAFASVPRERFVGRPADPLAGRAAHRSDPGSSVPAGV